MNKNNRYEQTPRCDAFLIRFQIKNQMTIFVVDKYTVSSAMEMLDLHFYP